MSRHVCALTGGGYRVKWSAVGLCIRGRFLDEGTATRIGDLVKRWVVPAPGGHALYIRNGLRFDRRAWTACRVRRGRHEVRQWAWKIIEASVALYNIKRDMYVAEPDMDEHLRLLARTEGTVRGPYDRRSAATGDASTPSGTTDPRPPRSAGPGHDSQS